MMQSPARSSGNNSSSLPDNVAPITRICLRKFESCLSISSLRQDEWAENRLAEFRFWIASVGALAPSKASLDYRLESANETAIQFSVVQLLKLLNTFLEALITTSKIARSLPYARNN